MIKCGVLRCSVTHRNHIRRVFGDTILLYELFVPYSETCRGPDGMDLYDVLDLPKGVDCMGWPPENHPERQGWTVRFIAPRSLKLPCIATIRTVSKIPYRGVPARIDWSSKFTY